MSGEFSLVNKYLIEDLKKINLWNQQMLEQIKSHDGDISQINAIPTNLRDKYKETFAIDAEWLIKSAAHRGKWIDQSQALNIFLKTTSGKRLSEVYQYAWEMGLKTTYYLRTLAASGIEKSTVALNQQKINSRTDFNSIPPTSENINPPLNQEESPQPIKLCKISDPDCEACQ